MFFRGVDSGGVGGGVGAQLAVSVWGGSLSSGISFIWSLLSDVSASVAIVVVVGCTSGFSDSAFP